MSEVLQQNLTCSVCKQELPRDQFRNNRNSRTGKQSFCRECHSEASRVWRENNAARERANVAARHRRERVALAAYKKREQERQIRRVGGPVAESYGNLRRAAQSLQQAVDEQAHSDVRAHLRSAMTRIHEAEDAITTALKLS